MTTGLSHLDLDYIISHAQDQGKWMGSSLSPVGAFWMGQDRLIFVDQNLLHVLEQAGFRRGTETELVEPWSSRFGLLMAT